MALLGVVAPIWSLYKLNHTPGRADIDTTASKITYILGTSYFLLAAAFVSAATMSQSPIQVNSNFDFQQPLLIVFIYCAVLQYVCFERGLKQLLPDNNDLYGSQTHQTPVPCSDQGRCVHCHLPQLLSLCGVHSSASSGTFLFASLHLEKCRGWQGNWTNLNCTG
jgi:hypothetical protein